MWVAFSLLTSCGNLVDRSLQNSSPNDESLSTADTLKRSGGTIFRSTVLAALRQPMTTIRQGVAVAYYRPRELVAGSMATNLWDVPGIDAAPGSEAFEQLLDEEGLPELDHGTLKWLVDGEGFFTELDRQLAEAERSIRIQLFIFDNDDIAVRYADKLKRKSERAKIKILWDDLGTLAAHQSSPKTRPPSNFRSPANMKKYLTKDSAVKVRRTLNPWLVADHTKLLVFDEETAILGGMNMGREYFSEWHDLMVRVEGPVVGRMTAIFDRAWKTSGPFGDFVALGGSEKFTKNQRGASDIALRVLRTDAGSNRHEIMEASLLAIRGAKKRIYIENPYFASDEIVMAVSSAAKRGVDVRVILPSEGDSKIMDIGNLASARVLIQAGAKLYRYPRMAHLKVMVCDDWATMGSANLDTLSMRINRELNIAFSNKKEVAKLIQKVFRPDFAKSRRMTLKETDSALAPAAEFVADQL